MGFWDRFRRPKTESRFSFQDWVELFTFNGQQYTLPQTYRSWRPGTEGPSWGFPMLASSGYASSGVVFACVAARLHVFSQVRYQFQELRGGRPGDLFGTGALAPLERPWVNGSTGNLNTKILVHGDLGGNAFITPNSLGELKVLRPDWVTIVAASSEDDPDTEGVDARIQGYIYQPGGAGGGKDPVFILPSRMAHYAPYPDPLANWRGISPLSTVAQNVASHKSANQYKERFFENGATPNAIVKLDPTVNAEAFKFFKDEFERQYSGTGNAFRTWFLGGGADATIVGSTFNDMNFKQIQGADETQICAAFGVPVVLVGLAEGQSGSGLNQGNYDSAKRQFADTTIQHLAQEAASALETLIPAPSGSRLWFDTRDVPFFRQDESSEADVRFKDAQTIRQLIEAGFDPKTAVAAVTAGDWGPLSHTGLVSVQLQPPGQQPQPAALPA